EVLLKQNGHVAVDAELKALNGLLEAEERRVRRLTRWTIAVWALWLLAGLFNVGYLMLAYEPNYPAPATLPAAPSAPSSWIDGVVAVIIAIVAFASLGGIVILPV